MPLTVIVAAAVYALVALVTRRTALGMLVEAVGINPEASRLAGVRSRSIVWTVYVFAALCAGVAGLMISSNVNAADANNAGLWLELDAILAVVIGGTSLAGGRYSIAGTLLGALIIQTLTTTIYSVGIPPEVTLVFKAVVVILVCLPQAPKVRALLARRRRRPDGPATAGGACRARRARPTTERGPDDREQPVTAPRRTRPDRHRAPASRTRFLPVVVTFALFVLMFVGGGLRYEAFASGQVLLNLLIDNAFLVVLAVGMTFVILTGGIDLSVGSVVALSTMVAARAAARGLAAAGR